jgi:hypothetical protein
MCDTTSQPPSNIICNKHHRSLHLQSQRKHIRKHWRGSHQGYSGDIDAVPTSCSDNEDLFAPSEAIGASTSTTASSSIVSMPLNGEGCARIQFYNDMPKRRSRSKCKSVACIDSSSKKSKRRPSDSSKTKRSARLDSEIDLSQVRIVSHHEYDLHLFKKERDFMKKVLNHHGIDPSDPSQSESDSSDTEKRSGYVSGPLAVIDHGPVFEFNKKSESSCSLLNEIYNIDAARGKSSTSSLPPVLSGVKRAASSPLHLLDGKRCRRDNNSRVEHTSLTMDEAVSFSPFARYVKVL